MKKYSLFIYATILFSCSAQKLKGVYCHSFNGGDDVSCLSFFDGNQFTYKTSGDLGTYLSGKGNYALKKNLLELKFDKDSIFQRSEVKITNGALGDKQGAYTIDLIFKLYDGNNKETPLYGAYVQNASENTGISKINYVNRNGVLAISKPRNSKTESYIIGSIFYETVEIPVKYDSTKEINVILYPSQPQKVSDTTHLYKLKKIGKQFFLTNDDHLYKKRNK